MQVEGKQNLILWVLEDNPNSRAFYEALGGKLVGNKLYDVGGTQLPVVAYGWDDVGALVE